MNFDSRKKFKIISANRSDPTSTQRCIAIFDVVVNTKGGGLVSKPSSVVIDDSFLLTRAEMLIRLSREPKHRKRLIAVFKLVFIHRALVKIQFQTHHPNADPPLKKNVGPAKSPPLPYNL